MAEVTVRFFAAAEEAAGTAEAVFVLQTGSTLAELLAELVRSRPELTGVLLTCSYLRNGVAVVDHRQLLTASDVVDVLPLFSGG